MSTYYYLDCKKCEEAVFVTNDKGDPPEREDIKSFVIYHTSNECHVALETEHTIEFDHIENFNMRLKKAGV